jgi:Helicase associated domain
MIAFGCAQCLVRVSDTVRATAACPSRVSRAVRRTRPARRPPVAPDHMHGPEVGADGMAGGGEPSRPPPKNPPRVSDVEPHAESHRDRAWEARFADLRAFVDAHGHVELSRHDPKQAALYRWIVLQRHEWNGGKLSAARYRRLSAIPGFVWDKQYEQWKRNFFDLVAYKEKHGNCTVALKNDSKQSEATNHLARWAVKQRHLFKHGMLPDDRRRRLEGIGFQFCPDEDRFQARLIELKEYQARHGHVNVPRAWSENPSLARWVDFVRCRWRNGKLPVRHYRNLASVGFSFVPNEASWASHYASLSAFVREHGHARPSFLEDRVLNKWLVSQRKSFATATLSADKRQMLMDLGVDFRSWRLIFGEGLAELRAFYRRHGHLNVPPDSKLSSWISQVRSSGRKSLSLASRAELESLGFDWSSPTS